MSSDERSRIIDITREHKVKTFPELARLMVEDYSEDWESVIKGLVPGIEHMLSRNDSAAMAASSISNGNTEETQFWSKQMFRSTLKFQAAGIPLLAFNGFAEGIELPNEDLGVEQEAPVVQAPEKLLPVAVQH